MSSRWKQQPSKFQAVFMAVLACFWMASNTVAVLVEGRPVTFFFWLSMAINIGLFGACVWLYLRASANSRVIKANPHDVDSQPANRRPDEG